MVCIMLVVLHPHLVHGQCGKALDVGLAKFFDKLFFHFDSNFYSNNCQVSLLLRFSVI